MLVDFLNIGCKLDVILDVFNDFHLEIVYDSFNTLMPHHHFLMMTFDLMGIPGP
jgi:hypothetical protein